MKKSFILFVDSLGILEEMTDEQAGKFIKIIYQYQKTGSSDCDDLIIGHPGYFWQFSSRD